MDCVLTLQSEYEFFGLAEADQGLVFVNSANDDSEGLMKRQFPNLSAVGHL